MKTISPKDYREDASRSKDGARAKRPGRQAALEEKTIRIKAHEIRVRKALQGFLKRKECPYCKQGHTLTIRSRPTKHLICKVCGCSFQYDHYFNEEKKQIPKLFEEI